MSGLDSVLKERYGRLLESDATSVFALAVTAAVGAAIHALNSEPAWTVVSWSIPGVLVGSTLGSRLGKHLPASLMERILGGLFALVRLLVLGPELLARWRGQAPAAVRRSIVD